MENMRNLKQFYVMFTTDCFGEDGFGTRRMIYFCNLFPRHQLKESFNQLGVHTCSLNAKHNGG